jgi:hypothetical protein
MSSASTPEGARFVPSRTYPLGHRRVFAPVGRYRAHGLSGATGMRPGGGHEGLPARGHLVTGRGFGRGRLVALAGAHRPRARPRAAPGGGAGAEAHGQFIGGVLAVRGPPCSFRGSYVKVVLVRSLRRGRKSSRAM